jgi:hypothetical protein
LKNGIVIIRGAVLETIFTIHSHKLVLKKYSDHLKQIQYGKNMNDKDIPFKAID